MNNFTQSELASLANDNAASGASVASGLAYYDDNVISEFVFTISNHAGNSISLTTRGTVNSLVAKAKLLEGAKKDFPMVLITIHRKATRNSLELVYSTISQASSRFWYNPKPTVQTFHVNGWKKTLWLHHIVPWSMTISLENKRTVLLKLRKLSKLVKSGRLHLSRFTYNSDFTFVSSPNVKPEDTVSYSISLIEKMRSIIYGTKQQG